jgi:hypothetical protein
MFKRQCSCKTASLAVKTGNDAPASGNTSLNPRCWGVLFAKLNKVFLPATAISGAGAPARGWEAISGYGMDAVWGTKNLHTVGRLSK